MRKKTIFRRISITEEVYLRLREERKYFQDIIGCGKWSYSDALTEIFKILDEIENEANDK